MFEDLADVDIGSGLEHIMLPHGSMLYSLAWASRTCNSNRVILSRSWYELATCLYHILYGVKLRQRLGCLSSL